MVEENKYEGAGDPIKILVKEALEKQRNVMMDNFAQILQRLATPVHLHCATTLEAPLLLRLK